MFGSVFLKGGSETKGELKEIDKQGEKTGSKLGKMGKAVAKGAAIAGGAVLGLGTAISGMAQKGAAAADRVDKLSQRLGLSREGFQKWDFVLSQAGVSIDSMQMGMKTLSQRMGEAIEGAGKGFELFDQLGIKITESMSQEEAFNETIKALQNMEDGVEKAVLAQELFGRNGQDLLPLLNSTAESTEELKKKAEELGLVMSDEAINAGVKLTDTLDQLKRTLSGAMVPILAGVMPLVTEIAQLIIQYIPQITGLLKPLFESIMPVFSNLVASLLPVLITLFNAVATEVMPPFLEIFNILITQILPPFIELFNEVIVAILPIIIDLLKISMEVLKPVLELLAELLEVIMPPLISILKWASEVIQDELQAAFESIRPVIDAALKIFKEIIDFVRNVFAGDWEAAWKNVANIFKNIMGSLKEIVKAPINFIISSINTLFRGLNKLKIPKWVPGVGGKGINLPLIPELAKGGVITSAGAAIINEAGPEEVILPTGAKVRPLTEDEKSGDTRTVTINMYNPQFKDGTDFGKKVNRVLYNEKARGVFA